MSYCERRCGRKETLDTSLRHVGKFSVADLPNCKIRAWISSRRASLSAQTAASSGEFDFLLPPQIDLRPPGEHGHGSHAQQRLVGEDQAWFSMSGSCHVVPVLEGWAELQLCCSRC